VTLNLLTVSAGYNAGRGNDDPGSAQLPAVLERAILPARLVHIGTSGICAAGRIPGALRAFMSESRRLDNR
jgi:hypothetical protein